MASITIDQVRSVDWANKFDWDIRLPDAPAPFDTWFPAFDVDEDIAIVEEFQFPDTQLFIPQKTRSKELKISFHDSSDYKLLSFFQNWIEKEIFNSRKGVSSLVSCCKDLFIYKKDRTGKIVKESGYKVFPTGQIVFSGNTSNESQNFTVSFRIVSRIVSK